MFLPLSRALEWEKGRCKHTSSPSWLILHLGLIESGLLLPETTVGLHPVRKGKFCRHCLLCLAYLLCFLKHFVETHLPLLTQLAKCAYTSCGTLPAPGFEQSQVTWRVEKESKCPRAPMLSNICLHMNKETFSRSQFSCLNLCSCILPLFSCL